MKKKYLTLALVIVVSTLVLMACAAPRPVADFSVSAFDAAGYRQKVDSFQIVYDASSSMAEIADGVVKQEVAAAVLKHFNQAVPRQLPLKAALRSFGHSDRVSERKTERWYGLTDYTREGLEAARLQIGASGGTSPLDVALTAAAEDLGTAAGRTALILISDGEDMGGAPLAAARALAAQLSGRLCLYTIQVGSDPAGGALLRQIAAVTDCGRAVPADSLLNAAAMTDFARGVFLGERLDSDGDGVPDLDDRCAATPPATPVDTAGCPLDTDGDGVVDSQDRCPQTPSNVAVDGVGCPLDKDADGVPDYKDGCPGTPAAARVDAQGCPLDSDRDGVPDYRDRCPATARGVGVDTLGCPLPQATESAVVTSAGTWLYKDIKFDSGKWDIKAASVPVLEEIVAALKKSPALKAEIQGHTDSRGKRAYNLRLSEKRAQAVVDYLVKAGIAAGRLSAKGYGPDRPMATNKTDEGRAQNRRVELKPLQ